MQELGLKHANNSHNENNKSSVIILW